MRKHNVAFTSSEKTHKVSENECSGDEFSTNELSRTKLSETAELLPVQYEPRDPESDSFRVIVTIPGLEEHMINCEMWYTSIKDEERISLSYTWLPSTPSHEVRINGRIATVEENLWSFLRAACTDGIEGPLWIDSVSINQANNDEKGRQVPLMSQIYNNAEEMLIWLGCTKEKGR